MGLPNRNSKEAFQGKKMVNVIMFCAWDWSVSIFLRLIHIYFQCSSVLPKVEVLFWDYSLHCKYLISLIFPFFPFLITSPTLNKVLAGIKWLRKWQDLEIRQNFSGNGKT